MKKYFRSFICLTVWLFLFPVLCAAKTDSVSGPSATSGKVPTNGEFTIFVQESGVWEKVGTLAYDKHLTEKKLSLNNHSGTAGKISVKIEQRGGGAAHIDSVFLDGKPPVEVKSIDNGLMKLSRKDFDVIDAFGKTIELVFDAGTENHTLSLAARIESTVISKIPFQFPTANTYRKLDGRSSFYTYRLNSEQGSIQLDAALEGVAKRKPFFKEFSQTGSGHPSGYTYGWVWNDDKNLYVAMDFTPDNTMDGDKDYAKVYTSVEGKIKEFKISVPEQTWGTPGFTYTKNVGYQHKTYEFTLPLKEIFSGDIKQNKEIRLAFAAYGTASVLDTDGDGIPDDIEDGAPNGGDGNGDGIPDKFQGNVTSLPSAMGNGYLTLETEGEVIRPLSLRSSATIGPPCQNSDVQALTEGSQPRQDGGFNFPFGLISFKVEDSIIAVASLRTSQALSSVMVTIYYHGATSLTNFTYRKYGPFPDPSGTAQWYTMPGVTFGTALVGTASVPTASFTIIDNGTGDDDGTVGIIVDQGGAGDPVVSIPTMTEWGMIMFIVLAGAGSCYYLRRKRRA